MEFVKLNDGNKMPIVGFGTFQLTDKEVCKKAVLDALKVGYRLIDTAESYANEEFIGEAIKESKVPREEIFVTTKVFIYNAGYEKAKKAIDESLRKLGLDYIDLYLIHQPFGDYYGSYRAMCEAQKEGKIKSIGISNFRPDRLVDLCMNQEIKPAVNQIEINPFDQNYEEERVMREYGVQPEAWAPFAEGKNDIFHNEILTEIGKKYNKSVAQVILRWLVQRGIVVLTKSTDINRIKENFDIFNFELSKEDMKKIKEINTGSSQFFNHYDPEIVKMLNNLHGNLKKENFQQNSLN